MWVHNVAFRLLFRGRLGTESSLAAPVWLEIIATWKISSWWVSILFNTRPKFLITMSLKITLKDHIKDTTVYYPGDTIEGTVALPSFLVHYTSGIKISVSLCGFSVVRKDIGKDRQRSIYIPLFTPAKQILYSGCCAGPPNARRSWDFDFVLQSQITRKITKICQQAENGHLPFMSYHRVCTRRMGDVLVRFSTTLKQKHISTPFI
jgi:hypothetical protein